MKPIPVALGRLPELTRNLWWSWHPEARGLFEALAGAVPEPPHHNPVQLLHTPTSDELEARAKDREFLDRYRYVLAAFDDELTEHTRPPLEASGTSGQKAALNGVPSLSGLDGWWAEAYDGTNGWAIGAPYAGSEESDARDVADADALYRLLEIRIVPTYYERDPVGLPRKWLGVMRRAIQTVAPHFSARRMVKEYVERLYLPAWNEAAGRVSHRS